MQLLTTSLPANDFHVNLSNHYPSKPYPPLHSKNLSTNSPTNVTPATPIPPTLTSLPDHYKINDPPKLSLPGSTLTPQTNISSSLVNSNSNGEYSKPTSNIFLDEPYPTRTTSVMVGSGPDGSCIDVYNDNQWAGECNTDTKSQGACPNSDGGDDPRTTGLWTVPLVCSPATSSKSVRSFDFERRSSDSQQLDDAGPSFISSTISEGGNTTMDTEACHGSGGGSINADSGATNTSTKPAGTHLCANQFSRRHARGGNYGLYSSGAGTGIPAQRAPCKKNKHNFFPKYVHLRPTLNPDMEKYIVIMSPFLREENSELACRANAQHRFYKPMNFIIWNCRGSISRDFRLAFKELIANHKPSLVVLLETHRKSHQSLPHEFSFSNVLAVPAEGRTGGMPLLWHDDLLSISNVSVTH
ncbi:hypothetical protein FXO38_03118 [Capsicum annuum]|nr:hypothetical protein FXO37_26384 [Capsicum annuum]KAF3678693.1 hypothetical protein FXO38_03118 [Capsicum annuum]